MKVAEQRRRVCVLGGTSRVWQAMLPFWRDKTSAQVNSCVWARRDGPGVDVVSSLSEAAEALPSCDVVVSLWGVTSGTPCALAENASLAKAAQEIGRNLGAIRVLHAMTGAVYAPSDDALSETADTVPRHPYGQSKLKAEEAVSGALPKAVLLRLGNVAGTDALADAVQSGRDVLLDQFGDGSFPQRSYIAPDDLATVLRFLIMSDLNALPDLLNVAGPSPVGMDDVLRAAGVRFSSCKAAASALSMQHLDVTRLANLGITARQSADPRHIAQFLNGPTKAE